MFKFTFALLLTSLVQSPTANTTLLIPSDKLTRPKRLT